MHAKLAEIRQVVEGARSMPMSASAVVNRAELLACSRAPGARFRQLADAQKVFADRDGIVDDGRREAEQIIADAREERERLTSDTEVVRLAKREAGRVDDRGRTRRPRGCATRPTTTSTTKLANFEITLERTIEAVRRGRERLAGADRAHALTPEEADKIVLAGASGAAERCRPRRWPGAPTPSWPRPGRAGTLGTVRRLVVRAPVPVSGAVICCAR